MRTEVDVATRSVDQYASSARGVVEEHAREVVGNRSGERGIGEHGADVARREVGGRSRGGAASGLTSTAPRPSAAASAVMKAGLVGSRIAARLPLSARTSGATALEKRESSGNELLCFELVDASAVRGERQW